MSIGLGTVGASLTVLGVTGPVAVVNPPGSMFLPGVNRLRVAFDVRRQIGADPSTATIRVWGLSEATRQLIAGLTRRPWEGLPDVLDGVQVDRRFVSPLPAVNDTVSGTTHAVLTAGYPGLIAEVFSGAITSVRQQRDGGDVVTEIECVDGGNQRAQAIANKSFPPGTNLGVVLAYLASTLGVVPGFVAPSAFSDAYVSGLTLQGPAIDAMPDLFDAAGYDWWIDGGRITVTSKGAPVPGQPLLVVDAVGQVLTGQWPLLEDARRSDSETATARAALIPGAELGRVVQITSREVRGPYRVEVLEHSGDSEGGTWETAIVGSRVRL